MLNITGSKVPLQLSVTSKSGLTRKKYYFKSQKEKGNV
jgi:hypothetical protein